MMSSSRAPRLALRLLPRRTQPTNPPGKSICRQISSRASIPILSSTSRPRILPKASPRSLVAPLGKRTIFIQTETTPNVDAIKFRPNHRVIPASINVPYIEYLTPRHTIAPPYPSPLASQLMDIEGVTSVFYGTDFITVTKKPETEWAHIKPEIFALITQTLTSGSPIVTFAESKAGESGSAGMEEEDSLAYNEDDSEVVGMIKELLETRVRPAIQEDGGDIEYRGFENGYVLLKLRGACRTCSSGEDTLKQGIEGMLVHYIEEVKGVQQVQDPEEEISAKEFARFEEKLQSQQGKQASAWPPHLKT